MSRRSEGFEVSLATHEPRETWMRTLIVAVMALGLSLNGWNAYAQEDQRHALAAELAEELLNEMNMKEIAEKTSEEVQKRWLAQMPEMKREAMEKADASSGVTKPTDEAIDKMLAKMVDIMIREFSWEAMKEDYTTVCAETFTEEELQVAIAFYKSPAGKAFMKKKPTVMGQSAKLWAERLSQVMPKLQAISVETMKEATPQPTKTDPSPSEKPQEVSE
jgi:hypothetical protein